MDQEQPTPRPQGSRRRLQLAVALTLAAAVAILVGLQVSGLVRIGGGQAGPAAQLPARLAIVDAAGGLTTMDDHGSSVVRHPVDGVEFKFPVWSPDGSRVAAIGSGTEGDGVYVFQARREDGTVPATPIDPTIIYRSPDAPPFYLYWAPDGHRVTFLTQEPTDLALRVAPADGSGPDFVVRKGAPLYWDWVDPALALVNVGGGGSELFFGEIGLDGDAREPTATASTFRSPAMTRDGSHRAYMVDAGSGARSIVIEARDGTGRHEVPSPGLAAFTFAPAGGSLAFIAPSEVNTQPADLPIGPLRIVDVATGDIRTLEEGNLVAFFWSPDGRTIATLRIPAPGENEIASVAGGPPPVAQTPAAVAPGSGYDVAIAFIDVASGTRRTTQRVRITTLFGLQILPFFDQYALSHRFWSPDSASIVLPLVDEAGVDGIVVLSADGSGERRLGDGEMGFWSP